ncbi:MAG: histidine phosphatase family protein, partial [Propionibacteriaceae bacterium]|nr:histidine phosphatase family protein [Propionibacteriaceae bacterium]
MIGLPSSDRVLVVLRHSKSSWSTGLPDHDRPLSNRGRRDGVAAGQWLVAKGITPQRVLVSSSVRTRQTLCRVQAGGADVGPVQFLREIYDADEHDLLRLVQATDNAVETLMLIGHNPTLEDFVRLLARRVGNHSWWASMDEKFPTSAIAIIGFDGDWADVAPGVGALLAYAVPR